MPDTNRAPLSHRSPLKSPAKASPLKADKLTLDAPPPPSQRSSPAGKSQREPPVSHRTKTKKTKQKVQRSLHEASAARPSSPNASPGGSPKGASPIAKQAEGTDMSDEVCAGALREGRVLTEPAAGATRALS